MSSTLNRSAIYGIVNRRDGKMYVGSAVNVRLRVRQHFYRLRTNSHISKHLQRAFNLYGEKAFGVVVLETVDSPSQLISREQHYIDLFHPLGNDGYNAAPTAGSTLGIKRPPFSAQWLANMSESKKGEKNHFFGRTHSEEVRQVISAKTKERMADPASNYFYGRRFTGEQNYMFGRTHTPEARAKIALTSKGRRHTPEAKRGMSESRKGRSLIANQKAVIQLDGTGVEIARFPSLTDAANAVRCTIQCISIVLRGKGKTAKGFQWRYAECK